MAKDGFSLDKFIGANSDFARGYTFYVTINGNGFSDTDKYLVKTSSLPAGTIEMIETNWQGNKYKLAGTQDYTDFTISFNVNTGTGNIRNRFVKWQESIHDTSDNSHGSPVDYMSDITVEHLNHINGEVVTEYKLIKAWPTSVTELTLDYADKAVSTFDVTFTYQRHTVK